MHNMILLTQKTSDGTTYYADFESGSSIPVRQWCDPPHTRVTITTTTIVPAVVFCPVFIGGTVGCER